MNHAIPPTEDTFHLGIKAIIRNPQGQILLLKVNPAQLKGNQYGAYWDIPGGRIQRGSTPEETLGREVAEETGLTNIISTKPFSTVLSPLRIPVGSSDVGLVLSAYLCEVAETDHITLSPEHTDFAWYSPGEAASLLQIKYPSEFTNAVRSLVTPSPN